MCCFFFLFSPQAINNVSEHLCADFCWQSKPLSVSIKASVLCATLFFSLEFRISIHLKYSNKILFPICLLALPKCHWVPKTATTTMEVSNTTAWRKAEWIKQFIPVSHVCEHIHSICSLSGTLLNLIQTTLKTAAHDDCKENQGAQLVAKPWRIPVISNTLTKKPTLWMRCSKHLFLGIVWVWHDVYCEGRKWDIVRARDSNWDRQGDREKIKLVLQQKADSWHKESSVVRTIQAACSQMQPYEDTEGKFQH